MTFFILLVEQPLVRVFGWSLLHFVWEGAIVAGLLAVALWVLRGRTAQVRYGVACGALVLMTVLPLATFGYLAMTARGADAAITHSFASTGFVIGDAGGFGGMGDSWLGRMAASLDRSLPWILAAWGFGVMLFMGRLNVGLMVARRMTRTATQAASLELQRVFQDLKQRVGVTRAVRLAHSALVQVPTVIGWLRPVVLIPVGCLAGLSAIQVEAIFAHELAHIRRHDYLVSVLQSFVEAVLFYHPAVWWVSKQVRKEREDCCDDLAVRTSGDSLAYAKALSLLEEYRSSYPAVSLGANGGALVMRIRRLLGYEEAPAFSQLAGMTLLAVMIVAVALGVGTLARAQASSNKQTSAGQEKALQSIPVLYRKWVDEDVRWIITSEETEQFMKLSSDDQRNQFIQQFWERRNLEAAGNGENAYRAEYYRRLAYANEHFAGDVPGWKSDRGRIFLVYGLPDSIDSHPGSDGATKPYEVWHYKLVREYAPPVQVPGTQEYKTTVFAKRDVDMKFIDTCACGNYQLQTPPQ
jgi:GWxTD domain-containing protein